MIFSISSQNSPRVIPEKRESLNAFWICTPTRLLERRLRTVINAVSAGGSVEPQWGFSSVLPASVPQDRHQTDLMGQAAADSRRDGGRDLIFRQRQITCVASQPMSRLVSCTG